MNLDKAVAYWMDHPELWPYAFALAGAVLSVLAGWVKEKAPKLAPVVDVLTALAPDLARAARAVRPLPPAGKP